MIKSNKQISPKLVAKNVSIDKTAKIICKSLQLGKNIIIQKDVELKARTIKIGDNSIICSKTKIHSGIIEIGSNSKIESYSKIFSVKHFRLGNRSDLCICDITGYEINIGDDFFSIPAVGQLLIVEGGLPTSRLSIGNRCTIHAVHINIAMPVQIGNDVGISNGTKFYTHYFWNSIFEGYPQKFAGITISDGCIIGADSFFLPGVTIAKNCIIGARSVVTKNIGANCVAVGNPAKIIQTNYQKKISPRKKLDLLHDTLDWYFQILHAKGYLVKKIDKKKLEYKVTDKSGKSTIILYAVNTKDVKRENNLIAISFHDMPIRRNSTILNLITRTISGSENELTDDLRDFLRKVGVRIFSNRRFKSIPFLVEM